MNRAELYRQRPENLIGYPEAKPKPAADFSLIAPLGSNGSAGSVAKKPREYRITAAMPHINTIEPLKVAVEVLRAQSERPYIVVIDTGSPPDVCAELEAMRADDLEIHFIRAHGYRHSSEPVTVALDLAQSLCQTDYLLHTHTDVFLRRQDAIETLLRITNETTPVVGYRMSSREWATPDWEWMVGHTMLMLHMPTIHRHGLTWSMGRMHSQFGVPYENPHGGWPDTETGFNNALRVAGIKPVFLGFDRNYERLTDDWMDHARSYPGTKLCNNPLFEKASQWMEDATTEARTRIKRWKTTL